MKPRLRPIPLTDDRGASCALVAPPSKWPDAAANGPCTGMCQRLKNIVSPFPRMPDTSWDAEAKWMSSVGWMGGTIIGGFLLVIPLIIASFVTNPPQWPSWLLPVCTALFVGLGVRLMLPFIWGLTRRRMSDQLRDGYLRASRCPSCGYSLHDLTPAPDGCTLCTECGSAWRVGAYSHTS